MNDGSISEKEVLQLKTMSSVKAYIGTFFVTKNKINNNYAASSSPRSSNKETTNTSTNKAKVQTCEAIVP